MNRKEAFKTICNSIDNKQEYYKDLLEDIKNLKDSGNKEKLNELTLDKKNIDSIVSDFSYFFDKKSNSLTYRKGLLNKEQYLTKNDFINKLETISNDMCFYTNRHHKAGSETRFPAVECKNILEGYIDTSRISIEDKIDFAGNAANATFYKIIELLIIEKDLLKDIDNKYASDFINNINDWSKEWIENKEFNNNKVVLIDAAQIILPYQQKYISITPSESVGLIKKTTNEIKSLSFSVDEQLKENKDKLSKLLKNKESSDEEKKELEETQSQLKSKRAKLWYLKCPWQAYVGGTKRGNISLKTSSATTILSSKAPSYNKDNIAVRMSYAHNKTNVIKEAFRILWKSNDEKFLEKMLYSKEYMDKNLEESVYARNKDFERFVYKYTSLYKLVKSNALKVAEKQDIDKTDLMDMLEEFNDMLINNITNTNISYRTKELLFNRLVEVENV